MFVSPLDSSPQVYSKSYPVKPKCTEINKDFQKDNFKHEIDIEALRKEQNLQEFINRTTKKGIYNDVQALVEQALKKQEDALDKKRERLKTLLDYEEMVYKRQLADHFQYIHEDSMKQRQEVFQAMKIQQEAERQNFLEQKRLQQHLNNCQDIRPHLRQKLLEESKLCQLKQIEDREKLAAAEKDENEMWKEIINKINNQQLFREKVEQELHHSRNALMVKVLDDQVSGRSRTKDEKRLAEAEERRLNELKSKETDQLEKERAAKELERQKCLASDLNKQKEEKTQRRQLYESEKFLEGKLLAAQIEREAALKRHFEASNKDKARDEIFEFLHYLEKMRDDEKSTVAEQEEIIKAYQAKIDKEALVQRENLKKQKRQLEEHTYNEQLRQINENKEKRLTELEAKLEETRRVNADLQQFRVLEKQAAERRQQNCMEMRHALQDQIGHRNDLQAKLKKQENEELENLKQLEEKHKQMTNLILTADTNILPLHPNYDKLIAYRKRF